MNQLILYGNIASGKSSTCRELVKLFPDRKLVCLDDYRKKLWDRYPGMGAGQRDLQAQELCLRDMRGHLIYETTGVTRFFKRAKTKMESAGHTLIYIHLDCPVSVCRSRYAARIQSGEYQAPFAWGQYTIEESMYYFDEKQKALPAAIKINMARVTPTGAARAIYTWHSSLPS